jgi:hypothetical protein
MREIIGIRGFAVACCFAVMAAILFYVLPQRPSEAQLLDLLDRIRVGMTSANVDAILHDSGLKMCIQVLEKTNVTQPDWICWICDFGNDVGYLKIWFEKDRVVLTDANTVDRPTIQQKLRDWATWVGDAFVEIMSSR